METNEKREFEAAFRLQQLATHTKLLDHAKALPAWVGFLWSVC
jgi:hypothetical protein